MNRKSAQFVGFFPKKTSKKTKWMNSQTIEEVCSISECISEGPESWIDEWKHNDLGFYDSESLARDIIGNKSKDFDLYAYKIFPFEFKEGKVSDYSIPVTVKANLEDFDFLGYDAVSRSVCAFFECSALSCNHGYEEYPVNRYCLFDDLDTAYQATIRFSQGNYEPGPYYLFEIYRKKGLKASSS